MPLDEFVTYDGKCGSCKHRGFRHWCPKTGIFRDVEESCNLHETRGAVR